MERPRRLRTLVALCTAITLASCRQQPDLSPPKPSNGEQAADAEQPQPAGEPDSTFRKPNPLKVSVTTSSDRPNSSLVTEDGGTLEAEALDGTKFVLTIPADALIEPVVVTMTPITSISGFTMSDSTVTGVDLSPDGLALWEPATLEVVPPDPGQDAVAFSYAGEGEEFHQFPLDPREEEFSLRLVHFSGKVLYLGDNISIPIDDSAFTPSSPLNQLEHELAELTNAERAAEAEGKGHYSSFIDKVEKLFDDYYKEIVEPRLGRIATDCPYAENNAPGTLAWAQFASVWGVAPDGDPRVQAVLEAALAGLENCWDEIRGDCVRGDKVKKLIALARQIQFLGGSETEHGLDDVVEGMCGEAYGVVNFSFSQQDSATAYSFRRQDKIALYVHLDRVGGGWQDSGSVFGFDGSESAVRAAGGNEPGMCPPANLLYQSSWHSDGAAADLALTQEGSDAYLSAGFSAPVNGSRQEFGEGCRFESEIIEDEYFQTIECDLENPGSGAKGKISDDGSAVTFSCGDSITDGPTGGDNLTSEMTVEVSGFLQLRRSN